MANTISQQPTTNSANAAYKPILLNFTVDIAAADCPAAFCDIYINGIYYKSQSKTQPTTTVASVSKTFQFDIQDPLQEYLQKYLASNGGHAIVDAASLFAGVFCRFRNTTLDADGFIVSNGTAPIQATASTPAISGTGLISNPFYVVDATLQHEENPDLTEHLSYYKTGTWNTDMYPLSHRPPGTKIGLNDSDYFPVLNVSNDELECIRLKYRLKSSNTFTSVSYCAPVVCVPVGSGSTAIPDGVATVPYSANIALTGSTAFILGAVVKPAWLSITIVGSNVVFSGTPTAGDIGTNIPVSFTVTNDCGDIEVSETIDVIVFAACVAVAISGSPDLPAGVVGTPYSYSFGVTGSAPFTLGSVVKPSWMTIAVSGSTIVFSGTPTLAETINVSFNILNCAGTHSVPFSDSAVITGTASCRTYEFAVFGPDSSAWAVEAVNCDGTPYNESGTVGGGGPGAACLQIDTVLLTGTILITDYSHVCG